MTRASLPIRLSLWTLLSAALLAPSLGAVTAQAQQRPAVPAALAPWTDWVRHNHDEWLCVPLHGEEGDDEPERRCVWPATLSLQLGERAGAFSLRVTVDAPALVELPGDDKHWPLDVRANGASAIVIERDGHPSVELAPGVHVLSGQFLWDTLPDALAVPNAVGLVELTVRGSRVRAPERDDDGMLYLSREDEEAEEREENRLEVVVHRLVVDDVPLRVLTRVELFVSGKNREELVGPALLEGLTPMSLQSPIPARLESDGSIRVQARPGRFVMTLEARHPGNPKALRVGAATAAWGEEEIWAFEALPQLRQVEIIDATAIDPRQTTTPAEWKRLPTYRLRAGEAFTIEEKRRGDADPSPDQIALNRSIWLDFDGDGYTFKDSLSGRRNTHGRLELPPPLALGRVAVSGADQFITQLGPDQPAGVELKRGVLNLEAESRLASSSRELSAVGWRQDFSRVDTTLYLPPGWRLLSAFGVDKAHDSWFARWTLLELFFVMVTSAAVAQLYGRRAGVVAAVALVLSVTEQDAPMAVWLVMLALEALVRVVKKHERLLFALKLGRAAVWVMAAIAVAEFAHNELRQALHPALEQEHTTLGAQGDYGVAASHNESFKEALVDGLDASAEPAVEAEEVEGGEDDLPKNAAPMKKRKMAMKKDEGLLGGLAMSGSGKGGGGYGASASDLAQQQQQAPRIQRKVAQSNYAKNFFQHDTKTIVQTGPGLPAWRWRSHHLVFSGPVTQAQQIQLVLLPPWIVRPLGFVRVGLVLLLLLVLVAAASGRVLPPRLGWVRAIVPTLALVMLAFVAPAFAQGAGPYPSQELLDELGRRLHEAPKCAPACASVGRMHVEAVGASLRLRLDVSAAALTSIPLPYDAKQWAPERVLVDGRPSEGLAREDGALLVRLTRGAHQVILEGPLPERDSVQIPLPLKPHYVSRTLAGWTLDGVHEDGQADETLQLSRTEPRQADKKAAALQAGALPAFVTVTRKIELGLSWQVETTVSRQTPLGTAVVLDVPLLDGESVTSAEVRVEAGRVLVNMGPQQREVVWRSVLKERPDIVLKAKAEVPWTEVWQLDASPLWHVETDGFAPIMAQGSALPEWRPWPNEQVSWKVSKPSGAAGQSLTIDKTQLELSPGARATDAKLRVHLRSSRGGQHVIKLPPDADVQSVSMNGAAQQMRAKNGELSLPLQPGAMTVEIEWREPRGAAFVWQSSAVDLGKPSVNNEVVIRASRERWPLLGWGKGVGPAIAFWGLLCVLAIAAVLLGGAGGIPLSTGAVFLLGLGITQAHPLGVLVVVGWFFWLAKRKPLMQVLFRGWYACAQLGTLFWTFAVLGILLAAVSRGLLVQPEMQISGNGSNDALLRWFVDRSDGLLPQATFVSAPVLVYRGLMLLWALWLARSVLGWAKWAWDRLAENELWKPLGTRRFWRWFSRD